MKYFSLTVGGMIIRFYFMMGVVVLAGFSGQFWLAVFALPIFLSIMMGVTFGKIERKAITKKQMKPITQPGNITLAAG